MQSRKTLGQAKDLLLSGVKVLFLLLSTQALASQYGYYPNSRLYLSGGFNPFTPTQGYLVCVDHEGEVPVDSQGAILSTVEMTMLKSREDFYNLVEFSASLAGSYLFFEGQGSVDMMNEQTFHSDSLSWMIIFKTDYGRHILKNPILKPRLATVGTDELFQTCGSEVITEQKKGVMVYSLLTISNLSKSQKSSLEAKFSASAKGALWSAKLDTHYKSFLSAALTVSDLKMKVVAIGGRGIVDLADLLSSQDHLLDYQKVPQVLQTYIKGMTSQNAVPTQFTSTPLKSFRDDLTDISLAFRKQQVGLLYDRYEEVRSSIKRISRILSQEDEAYGLSEDEKQKLLTARTEYDQVLNSIYDQAQHCFDLFTQDQCHLPVLALSPIRWPRLQKSAYCENQRRTALDQHLVGRDFYEMACRRNFIPVFETKDQSLTIDHWAPCEP